MKPMLVFVEEENGTDVKLTKEQLKKLISDAYEQGVADGKNASCGHHHYGNIPYIPCSPTDDRIHWKVPEVTCNDNTKQIVPLDALTEHKCSDSAIPTTKVQVGNAFAGVTSVTI